MTGGTASVFRSAEATQLPWQALADLPRRKISSPIFLAERSKEEAKFDLTEAHVIDAP